MKRILFFIFTAIFVFGISEAILSHGLNFSNTLKNPAKLEVKTKNKIVVTPTIIKSKSVSVSNPNTVPIVTSLSSSTPLSQSTSTINFAPKATFSFDSINDYVRSAVVNIICTSQSGGFFSAISGSGVVISPDGVIVTNAHVAQYFLLKDFNGQDNFIDCTIRTGSPAYPAYKARLVYISPQWIKNNKSLIVSIDPTGTGEYDYAFLQITSRIDGKPINTLPYISPDTDNDNSKGDEVLLASYPAGFLGGIAIIKDLYQVSAVGKISDVYTFGTSSIDVISIPGTVVSQKGSSGGGTVNSKGKLFAIISTSSDADTTGARELRSITLDYVNRGLMFENKSSIQELISNASITAEQFNQNLAPELIDLLTKEILHK